MSSPQKSLATVGFVVDLRTILEVRRRGDRTLVPGAKEAMVMLHNQRVPFTIVARETRTTERKVAQELSRLLAFDIRPSSIVLPHTPFRELASKYGDKNVLIIGNKEDRIRELASRYGFRHPFTTGDVVDLYPHLYSSSPRAKTAAGGRADKPPPAWRSRRGDNVQIHAIFVWWTSPENWELDKRIVVDLLLSKQGHIGTHSRDNLGYLRHWPEQQPQLYISKADTAAQTGYEVPVRDGRTWLRALEEEWAAEAGAGAALPCKTCGAGTDRITVEQADELLQAHNRRANPDRHPFPRTVYMVGGEIHFGAESDQHEVLLLPPGSRQARRRSIRVDPVLSQRDEVAVRDIHPLQRPWHVAANLKEAVEYALAEEYWDCLEAGLKPMFARPKGALSLVM